MPSSQAIISSAPRSQQASNSTPRIRVEFAVNISENGDLIKIGQALESKGIELASSDLQCKTIQLELTNVTDSELKDVLSVQRFIEQQTGIETIVKGLGKINSAVAELGSPTPVTTSSQPVMGVVRISQMTESSCFIDGFIDGFKLDDKQIYCRSVAIHEFGDLSGDKFENLGEPVIDIYNQVPSNQKDYYSMSLRKIVHNCDVSNVIGKSIAVTEHTRKLDVKRILSAGVIARASIIEENTKKFCSCSGKTLWEERLEKKQSEHD